MAGNLGKGQGKKQEVLPGFLRAGSLPGGHKALPALPFCLSLLLSPPGSHSPLPSPSS